MKYVLMVVCICVFNAGFAQQHGSVPQVKKLTAKEIRTVMDTTSGPLIVNFWATWCGPCIKEIPWFEQGIDKAAAPVKLLLVSLDFPEAFPTQLTAFVKKKGYKSEVLFLEETKADYFIPIIAPKWQGAIPASVFINNSKKYYEVFNHQLTEQRFELELQKLIQ